MNNRLSFTKDALSRIPLPAEGQRATYHDTKAPGLQLRVSHTGIKTFSLYRRTKAGAPERITLGRFPAMTVEQARKSAMELNAEIEAGSSPAEVKRSARAELTFAEAVELFLVGKRKRDGTPIGDKTRKDYRDLLRLHLDALKHRKLSAIERTEIKAIHTKVTKRSPAQADKCVALVSAVFAFLRDMEHYDGPNPAERVKKNPPAQRDRFLQADELPSFFRALGEVPNPVMRDFFLLALMTGARRSNVCAMRWPHIDLDAGIWRLAMTKNGTPQNVALSPEAVMILQARKDEAGGTGFVFPGSGKTGHMVEPKGSWATVLRRASMYRLQDAMQLDERARAGVEALLCKGMDRAERHLSELAAAAGINPDDYSVTDVRIHDLRRTLGSWQARTGASLSVIGKSLNHKTHQATAIYARLDLDPVRQSVNTATAAIMEAARLKPSADVIPLKRTA